MKTETLEYRDGGTSCRGILIYDETKSGRRPGIVIAPDIRGVGARPKGKPERLAALGYVVLIADMYGDATNMRDFNHGMELMKAVRGTAAGGAAASAPRSMRSPPGPRPIRARSAPSATASAARPCSSWR